MTTLQNQSEPFRFERCSFSLIRSTIDTESHEESDNKPIRKLKRSPSDEFLLTELALDFKDLTVYDISSLILVGEKVEKDPHGMFKCFMDHENKEFFIEVNAKHPLKSFTRSTLLTLVDMAAKQNALAIYVCVRNGIPEYASILRAFSFIGFAKLQEQRKLTISKTHTLLKYDLKGEDEELE